MGRRKNNPDLVDELIEGRWTMDQDEFEKKYYEIEIAAYECAYRNYLFPEEDGWTDVYRLAKGFRDETRGHHYCNPKGYRRDTGGTFEQAIDHILAKNLGNCTVESFRRLTPEYFDKASDHYPLYIELSI